MQQSQQCSSCVQGCWQRKQARMRSQGGTLVSHNSGCAPPVSAQSFCSSFLRSFPPGFFPPGFPPPAPPLAGQPTPITLTLISHSCHPLGARLSFGAWSSCDLAGTRSSGILLHLAAGDFHTFQFWEVLQSCWGCSGLLRFSLILGVCSAPLQPERQKVKAQSQVLLPAAGGNKPCAEV